MAKKRRYQLLCPIARALDSVGNRWALLIVRDLHAGPARFRTLQTGLGIATNLLATRLAELVEGGLVCKICIDGHDHYQLTATGLRTDRLIWELSRFGGHIAPDLEIRKPGNLRTLLLPMRFALLAAPNRPVLCTRFVVDDEPFTIRASPETVTVDYGDHFTTEHPPDLEVYTDYVPLIDMGEGRVDPGTFMSQHVRLGGDASLAPAFFGMLAAGFAANAQSAG